MRLRSVGLNNIEKKWFKFLGFWGPDYTILGFKIGLISFVSAGKMTWLLKLTLQKCFMNPSAIVATTVANFENVGRRKFRQKKQVA